MKYLIPFPCNIHTTKVSKIHLVYKEPCHTGTYFYVLFSFQVNIRSLKIFIMLRFNLEFFRQIELTALGPFRFDLLYSLPLCIIFTTLSNKITTVAVISRPEFLRFACQNVPTVQSFFNISHKSRTLRLPKNLHLCQT